MKADVIPTGLRQVRTELDAWRARRRKGDRIPADVWLHAAAAARVHGVSRTSAALGLGYLDLKRRTGRVGVAGTAVPGFVEVTGFAAAGAGERPEQGLSCVVELEKGNGVRMRICVGDAAAVDWGRLKEAFLGA